MAAALISAAQLLAHLGCWRRGDRECAAWPVFFLMPLAVPLAPEAFCVATFGDLGDALPFRLAALQYFQRLTPKRLKTGCSHAASVVEHLCTVLGTHKLWTVVRRLTCWPLQRRACWAHLHQFAVQALRRCRCMTNSVAALICCCVAHDVQCMTIASETGYAT